MQFIEVVLMALGLAMDAFAVSLGAATTGFIDNKRAVFRLSFHFGLFQSMMPVIGWFFGTHVIDILQPVDNWIAFGLLAFVGSRMILSGLNKETVIYQKDPSRSWSLVFLSVATSIDALAVGLSLALVDVNIWYPSVIIGLITAGMSLVGIRIGYKLGMKFGKTMEIIGGIILMLIGVRILLAQLLFPIS
ncbi:MAG: manganese efflux pump [Candidatus Marinimicrobia bacterium]|nr:manganese efflux pump [Candidatus Neomarinimicrobiota bacterium]